MLVVYYICMPLLSLIKKYFNFRGATWSTWKSNVRFSCFVIMFVELQPVEGFKIIDQPAVFEYPDTEGKLLTSVCKILLSAELQWWV